MINQNIGSKAIPRQVTQLKVQSLLNRSPALILAVVAVSVFLSDTVVTTALSHFDLMYHSLHPIIDSLFLLILLFPVLISLVFRPIEHNLAQLKRAEEELTAERNKLIEILDSMPAGVYIVNRSREIEYTNTAMIGDFGPVEGRKCYDYMHGNLGACVDCQFDQVLAGKSISREWQSEKTSKIYELFDTPLRNADGSVSKLGMMRDITTRKLVEEELLSYRKRLRALTTHLQQTREEERIRIAREIHDELGQVLATVQMGVALLVEDYRDHRHLIEKISTMEQLLASAIKTVRRISSELRPQMLDVLGLAEAIEWQAKELQKNTGIICKTVIILNNDRFERDVSTAVFRICQETLTNVIRHSEADRIIVTLEERKDRLVLVVKDNGKGVTREQLINSQSLGIMGMRERVLALGGRMKIFSAPLKGTSVIASIPVYPPREGKMLP